jgi:hypothetical protein
LIVIPPLGRGVLGLEVAGTFVGAMDLVVVTRDERGVAVEGAEGEPEHPETVKAAKITAAALSRLSASQVMQAR